MKKSIQIALLGLSMVSVSTLADVNLELEPCINGEVSSSGLFPTQAAEDAYNMALQQAEVLELEPCINGDVSESGLFESQAAEDHHRKLQQADNAGAQVTSTGRGNE